MGNYWDRDHSNAIAKWVDSVHKLGLPTGWRDRDAEGFTRNRLLALRVHGALNCGDLLADMRARGHDKLALKRLDPLIDKTFPEPGPHPEEQGPGQ